jgi:ATP-dependent Clp protease ATP-binding subunit ClpB
VVVFSSLRQEQLRQVLDLELQQVQQRIDEGAGEPFCIIVTKTAKEFLLAEGVDYRYGARHLKRAIERFVVTPLANVAATRQVRVGQVVVIDFEEGESELAFYRDDSKAAQAVAALDLPRAQQAGGQHNQRAA